MAYRLNIKNDFSPTKYKIFRSYFSNLDSEKNSFISKWKCSLLSKMICGENGNIMDCVSNIFKKLNNPSSYGMENTINVLIPVKRSKKL